MRDSVCYAVNYTTVHDSSARLLRLVVNKPGNAIITPRRLIVNAPKQPRRRPPAVCLNNNINVYTAAWRTKFPQCNRSTLEICEFRIGGVAVESVNISIFCKGVSASCASIHCLIDKRNKSTTGFLSSCRPAGPIILLKNTRCVHRFSRFSPLGLLANPASKPELAILNTASEIRVY